MSTVKINCPNCAGTGLIGEVVEKTCPQCSGTGTIGVDNSQTLATLDNSIVAPATSKLIVNAPKAVPTAAAKVLTRGK